MTIYKIGTAVPEFSYSQDYLIEKLSKTIDPSRLDVYKKMGSNSGIDYRYISYDLDEDLDNVLDMKLSERLVMTYERCKQLAIEACKNVIDIHGYDVSLIDNVIVATSTGLMAPSLDVHIAKALGLDNNVRCYCIGMKGCSVAPTALSLANDLPGTSLVVTVDVHSLHHTRNNKDMSDVIKMVIFGDGASAIIVENYIGHYQSKINTEFIDNMTIDYSEEQLSITLDKNVHKLMTDLYKSMDHDHYDNYIVHPGGRSILDEMSKTCLGNYSESYEIYRRYGNMSAATLLFVLKLADQQNHTNNAILVAFGQGITCSTVSL